MEILSHKPISFDICCGYFKNKEIIVDFRQEAKSYLKIFDELLEIVIIHEDKRILFINKQGLNLLELDSDEKLIGNVLNVDHINNPYLFLKSIKSNLNANLCNPESTKDILSKHKIRTTEIEILNKKVFMTSINWAIPTNTLDNNAINEESYINNYFENRISKEYNSEFMILDPQSANINILDTYIDSPSIQYNFFEELIGKMINSIIIYSIIEVENETKIKIKYLNSAAESLVSMNFNEVVGKEILDIFPNLQGSEFYNVIKRVYKTGLTEKTPISYYSDKRIKLWKQNYLFKLPSGEVVSIIDNMSEIVDLNNQLKKYKILFEQTKDIILFIDSNGSIIEANRAALKAYGYKKDELLLKNIHDLRGESTIHLVKDQMEEAKNKGVCFETYHKSKCGYKFPVEVSSIGTTIDGRKVYCSIIRDISERKKSQVNLQRSRKRLNDLHEYEKLRADYIANLSHEFMTPLNLILCSQQLIKTYLNNNSESKFNTILNTCNTISFNCNRLIKLSNNFLDMTKIDSGILGLNLEVHNIVNVVEKACEVAVQYANKKGISLTFDTDVEEKLISCDKEKVERIILNLLSNSIKFTSSGGKIYVNIFSNHKENIFISVKDTGIGLAKEKLKFIFNKFTQIDKSFTRPHEGAGLGLFLVKSLIDLHKGKIKVKSSPGIGSNFILELPTNLREFTKENKKSTLDLFKENYLDKAHIEFSDIYYD